MCVCDGGEAARRQLSEEIHFIWESEGAGRDSTFWLTKTMPGDKRLPKITADRRRKGVSWLVEWKIIDKGCSRGERRSVILS